MPAPAPVSEVPIWLAAGQLGLGLLGEAGVARLGRGGEGGVRAVGDARQGGGEAGRGRDVEGGEVLVAVGAGEVEREGAVGAGGGVGDGGLEAGVEGPRPRPGRVSPFGPESRVKNWVEVCSDRAASQGVKVLVTG